MSFMEEYKRLDNLCKDIFSSANGVTEYINCMEQSNYRNINVINWKNDLKKLKHYRYIRNQIAHENNATEESLCTIADTNWIKKFHDRIMEQTDPITLYRKSQEDSEKKIAQPSKSTIVHSADSLKRNNTSNESVIIILIFIITLIVCASLILGICFFI